MLMPNCCALRRTNPGVLLLPLSRASDSTTMTLRRSLGRRCKRYMARESASLSRTSPPPAFRFLRAPSTRSAFSVKSCASLISRSNVITAASPLSPIMSCVNRIPVRPTSASCDWMRLLVSTTTTIEIGSQLCSKPSIFWSLPLSRRRKSLGFRSVTNSPSASVTVTGTVTTSISTWKVGCWASSGSSADPSSAPVPGVPAGRDSEAS